METVCLLTKKSCKVLPIDYEGDEFMLRCTVASLIPLMLAENYKESTEDFYKENKKEFEDIIRHKSYYILRKLPVVIAERLLIPELPCLITKQMKNGMWKGDTERITYDILSAIKHISKRIL